jgi:ADP-ribosylglycohydrolase
MIGAICGDVIGSAYEWHNIKTKEFELFSKSTIFTDDSVLTVAVADCILNRKEYAQTFKEYGWRYPDAGYGGRFMEWLQTPGFKPYNSYGNGSAMRVSPVGFAFNSLDEVLKEAQKSAAVTHNHTEGIKGAQATAAAIFMARQKSGKEDIKNYISDTFSYDLSFTLEQIRPYYQFDVTCQGSVPQAIVAFIESTDYEDAIRNAISIGGDSDTIACITGGIAQAYYEHIPGSIIEQVKGLLDPPLLEIIAFFNKKYQVILRN